MADVASAESKDPRLDFIQVHNRKLHFLPTSVGKIGRQIMPVAPFMNTVKQDETLTTFAGLYVAIFALETRQVGPDGGQ